MPGANPKPIMAPVRPAAAAAFFVESFIFFLCLFIVLNVCFLLLCLHYNIRFMFLQVYITCFYQCLCSSDPTACIAPADSSCSRWVKSPAAIILPFCS
jgi:hypothetical protein